MKYDVIVIGAGPGGYVAAIRAAQLGFNYNTSRIKNFETTVGTNYKYGDSRSGGKSFRTTFQDDGNIFSAYEDSGREFSNMVSANVEAKKEKGKVVVRLSPSFRYIRLNSLGTSSSETSKEGVFVNSSSSDTRSLSNVQETAVPVRVAAASALGGHCHP